MLFSVSTDQRDAIEKMLLKTQKAHDTDKAKFKDVIANCNSIKQQSTICEVCVSKSMCTLLIVQFKNIKEKIYF